jgi:anaerobic magnesium-protoporphyrin IX monomethyl ester cyclase
MSRALLINPSYHGSYGNAKAGIINPVHPTLGLATIAGAALEKGHEVEIFDISSRKYDYREIQEKVKAYKPDIVGITATTPLMNQLRDISVLVKDISQDIAVIGGGPHPSALPYETMRESLLDAVFVGEADHTFSEYCNGGDPSGILGLFYRDGDEPTFTGWRPPIMNLDDLPMPAWHLYNIDDYHDMSKLYARRTPITMAEFSRGCVFKCDFCASKISMGMGYRKKSPERCAEEARVLAKLGFREFKLADDIFTSDQGWASAVCDALIEADTGMIWTASNGIRVESANDELFAKMAKAGCYRVSFGFESGNDEVLKSFGKGGKASIEQGEKAVRMARAAGLDTTGFFLLGLSPDTEETMNDTIEFARRLSLDILKFGVTVAFPGTPMFNKGIRENSIRSFDWDDYFIYSEEGLYNHPKIAYETILQYMDKAYKRAILYNPRFWIQRLIRGIRTAELFWDAYYFAHFIMLSATSKSHAAEYFARDKWPEWDLVQNPPRPSEYQKIGVSGAKKVA